MGLKMANKQANIKNSIVLMGPCGVGKSLISETLAKRTGMPKLDIDDLMFMIELDLGGTLSPNKVHQERFIKEQLNELKTIKRDTPLTEEELKQEEVLVRNFVKLYDYYYELLGGFSKFHADYYNYYKSTQGYTTDLHEVYLHNKLAMELIDTIYNSTDTPFIISPPASLGWTNNSILHPSLQTLQKEKINPFLQSTQTVLLEPGEDYYIKNPNDPKSVNSRVFMKNYENYYPYVDLFISTNGLFYEPENDFLKQRTWVNVREYLTKKRLKNRGEIGNICDQIINNLQDLEQTK